MWQMAWGWGGRLQRSVAAAALTLVGVLAFSAPALGGDPPPVPKPDPPPKANPPPPAPAPQPPAPVAPAAPAPVAPAPSVVHPTAAERRAAAEQRAAAKRRAQRKAARAARARAAQAQAAAQRRERAKDVLAAGNSSPSPNSGLPFLLAAFSLALVLFGLALTPAWAVPWRRGARALEARREELGVMGATGVVATVVFFLLIEVTK